jgi:hypothetical protein
MLKNGGGKKRKLGLLLNAPIPLTPIRQCISADQAPTGCLEFFIKVACFAGKELCGAKRELIRSSLPTADR